MAKNTTKKDRKQESSPELKRTTPKFKPPLRVVIDKVFEEEAVMREAITANLKDRRRESRAITERIETAFKNFDPSDLTDKELSRRHYVPPGQNIANVQKAVVEKGVEAIRAADVTNSITLRKTDAVKKLITESPAADGSVGTIPLDELTRFISTMPAASPSVIYSECRAEMDAQGILDQAEGKTPEKKTDEDQEDGEASRQATAEKLVKETVNRQMETATSPETRLLYNVPTRANQLVLQSSIDTFELRAGASDVTSYHDFNALQIAFAHVWTRIFDGELQSLGRELYHEYVKLKEFTGSDDPDLSIGTMDDLSRLLAEVKKLSQTVEDEVPPSLRPAAGQKENGRSGSITPEDGVRAGVAVATGGASLFIEWAFNELIALGNRPVVVTWNSFPLEFNKDKGNIIEMSVAANAVYPGNVEIVLETDRNSYKKQIVFQQWNQNTQVPIQNRPIQNFPVGPGSERDSYLFNTSQVPYGTLKFVSEDEIVNELLLGRYVLGDLSEVLKDRTQVTFRWKGQR
jgi:hypothetical protein